MAAMSTSTRFNLAKSNTYINCLINVYYRPIEDCVCSIEGPQKCLTAGHTQCCRTQLWGSFWIMLVFSGLTFKISTESGSTIDQTWRVSWLTDDRLFSGIQKTRNRWGNEKTATKEIPLNGNRIHRLQANTYLHHHYHHQYSHITGV